MGDKSQIEWTDATWNPVVGCSPVSEGCRNCYAARESVRLGGNPKLKGAYEGLAEMRGKGDSRRAVFTGKVRMLPDRLDQPMRWRKPRRIFVNSMSDLWHPNVPSSFIDKVMAVAALSPRHTFQILTKRPERAMEYMKALTPGAVIMAAGEHWGDEAWVYAGNWINGWSKPKGVPHDGNPGDGSKLRWPLPNVWIGTSVEDQPSAVDRIPFLRCTPAAVRFLSCEPLLGRVDLPRANREPAFYIRNGPQGSIHWVIVGGESGPNARPMHPLWAREIRDYCLGTSIHFTFKQWGAWRPVAAVYEENDEDGDADFKLFEAGLDPIEGKGTEIVALEPTGNVPQRLQPNHYCHYQPSNYSWWMARVGKKAAGRELDGRLWDEQPHTHGYVMTEKADV